MKILYILPDIDPTRGGIQTYLHRFLATVPEVIDTEERSVVRASRSLFSFVFGIIREVLFFRPDHIIIGHIHYARIGSLLNRVFQTTYWVMTYGAEVWDIQKQVLKTALQEADKVITISTFTRGKIIDQIKEIESNIHIIPCMADEQRFGPEKRDETLREQLSLPADATVLLTVCRLESRESFHSYDVVIDALDDIQESIGEVHYILVGRGNDEARVREKVQKLGLKKCVHLVGYVPDEELPHYYTLSDLFIMPSLLEGFGIVYLEALLSGIPVIAGNRDGSQDAVFDDQLGILVDPEKKDEMVAAVLEMVERRKEGDYPAATLRRLVLERFGLAAYKKSVEQLFIP